VNADKNLTPRLLVVGGTSSLAPGIYRLAEDSGYEIFATHRHHIPPETEIPISWHSLDLNSVDSIDEFLADLDEVTFSRVIFFIGATFGHVGQKISANDLAEYLRIHLVNPVNLIGRLVNNLSISEPSNLIYMSSRAASFGSADWPYGIAKAGIQNYISSLSQSQKPSLNTISVVTGLILGSSMQNEMNLETINSHTTRAREVGGNLLTLDEVAQQIWALSPDLTSNIRGSVLSLGPVY